MSKEEGNAEAAGQDNSGGDTTKKDAGADLYENRGSKKIIRLITVMAYMFSVSFVAIVLSAYYLFLWEPPNPRLIHRAHRLQADPQMEFLLGDSPVELNQSAKPFDFFSPDNNFLKNSMPPFESERKHQSPRLFSGRIAHDFTSNDKQRELAIKNRGRLNESLYRLRNTLVEFLRGKMNNSTVDTDSTSRVVTTSNPVRDAFIRRGKEFNRTETVAEVVGIKSNMSEDVADIWNRTILSTPVDGFPSNASHVFVTLESTTISGDEVSKNRFASVNITRKHSFPNETWRNYGSRRSKDFEGQSYPGYGNINWNSSSINSTDKSPINSSSGTVKTGEFPGYRRFSGNATINDNKGDIVARAKNESNFTTKYIDHVEFPPESAKSLKHSYNGTFNSKETQIEEVAGKSTAAVKDSLREELNDTEPHNATTQKDKDLLTILPETTSSDIVSSTTSSAPVSEGLSTDFNPTTKSQKETTT